MEDGRHVLINRPTNVGMPAGQDKTDSACPDSQGRSISYRAPWPPSVNPRASIGDR
jgi:hypothetical protein